MFCFYFELILNMSLNNFLLSLCLSKYLLNTVTGFLLHSNQKFFNKFKTYLQIFLLELGLIQYRIVLRFLDFSYSFFLLLSVDQRFTIPEVDLTLISHDNDIITRESKLCSNIDPIMNLTTTCNNCTWKICSR